MPGLKGEDAQIYHADQGDSTSMTAEAASDTGDGVTYQIDDAAKNIFDWGTTFTVSDAGGTVAASTYTIRWLSGVIVFDSTPTDPVTVDGAYFPKHQVFRGFESEATLDPNLLEVTQFQDTAPRRIKGIPNLDASFGSYEVLEKNIDADGDDDGPSLDDILLRTSGNAHFVFRFAPNDTDTNMLTAVVQMSEATSEASRDSPQTRSYSLEVDTQDPTMSTQEQANIHIFTV